MLRGLRVDMYGDGAATPAVSAPLGDLFGIGLGRTTAYESALFPNPEGRSFNSVVPMPFRTGTRIVLTNESGEDLRGQPSCDAARDVACGAVLRVLRGSA
jgi:hypothetical protein